MELYTLTIIFALYNTHVSGYHSFYNFDPFNSFLLDTLPLNALSTQLIGQSFCFQEPILRECEPDEDSSFWFFNSLAKKCEKIKECITGDNSFETQEACESRCMSTKSKYEKCSSPPRIGLSDCLSDQSKQPIRWVYFNKVTRTCDWYMYLGCGIGLNMFHSIEECNEACMYPETLKHISDNQQEICRELPDDLVYKQLDDDGKLSHDLYDCYEWNKLKTTTRWFYDAETSICSSFGFHHCSATSGNNFLSRDHCNKFCGGRTYSKQEICSLSLDVGQFCDKSPKEMWFFDPNYKDSRSQGGCRKFTFKGCGGNLNKYSSRAACLSQCQEMKICLHKETHIPNELIQVDFRPRELTMSEPCRIQVSSKPCKEPVSPNNQTRTRYFFNPNTSDCERIEHSGCEASANTFDENKDCLRSCKRRLIDRKSDKKCKNEFPGECAAVKSRGLSVYSYTPGTDTCFKKSLDPMKEMSNIQCSTGNFFATGEACMRNCARDKPTEKDLQNRCFARTSMQAGHPLNCSTEERILKWFYSWETDRCVPEEICTNGEDIEDYICAASPSAEVKLDTMLNSFNTQQECEKICRPLSVKDICTQPADKGPCSDFAAKYFFNSTKKECQSFIYGGCLGNMNRFQTYSECNNFCMPLVTVLNGSEKHTRSSISAKDIEVGKIAPSDLKQFLISRRRLPASALQVTGLNYQRYSENIAPSPCKESWNLGTCPIKRRLLMNSFHLNRYYYHSRSHQCKRFMFNGCGASMNTFETDSDCEERCVNRISRYNEKHCKLSDEDFYRIQDHQSSCLTGQVQIVWTYNEKRGLCENIEICRQDITNIKGIFITKNDCFYKCSIGNIKENQLTNICHLRQELRETEGCLIMQEQWYFDIEQGTCRPQMNCRFYGNNFVDRETCLSTCIPTNIIDVCRLPMDVGVSSNFELRSELRWYYDWKDHSCRPFLYGGSLGNSNRFVTYDECHQACESNDFCRVTPREVRYNNPSENESSFFYYDKEKGDCLPYEPSTRLFRSGNSFSSKEDCYNGCMKSIEIMTSQGDTMVPWTFDNLKQYILGQETGEDIELDKKITPLPIIPETNDSGNIEFEMEKPVNNVGQIITDSDQPGSGGGYNLENIDFSTHPQRCHLPEEKFEQAREHDLIGCDPEDMEESLYFYYNESNNRCDGKVLNLCSSKKENYQLRIQSPLGKKAIFRSLSECEDICLAAV